MAVVVESVCKSHLFPVKQKTTTQKSKTNMKKTILAALLLSGVISAHAGVAISDNIYGIINIPIVEGMNAVGINLLPMPGNNNAIENLIPVEDLTAAAEQSNADKVYVFNGTSYVVYWLDGSVSPAVWKQDATVSSPEVNPGQAVWIRAGAAGTIYQLGTLASDASRTVTLANGNNFVANPYPNDLDLATDVDWVGVAAPEKFSMMTADLIRVWTGSGYDTFYYVQSGAHPSATGWYNANTYQKATSIPAGEGFWFFRRNTDMTGNLVITTPFVQ